jgi:DNA-binding response OmpR family regulator
MIVEDDRDISMMFKSGLERKGYKVDVFNDPHRALAHFEPGNYDLLLLDIRMPGMSGFELFSEIKKKDGSTKACFVSAFEIHDDEIKRYVPHVNVNCIIKKPVAMKDLLRAVDEELARK